MSTQKENSELKKILEVLSGEKKLREEKEKVKKERKVKEEKAKDVLRKDIVEGKVEIGKDEEVKVVQNVKLFEWVSPERYQPQFNNKGFLIVLALALAFCILLAILGNYLLMASIMSMLFLLYVVSTTKPLDATHKITARGIETGDKLFEWYLFESFFMARKNGVLFLVVKTKLNYPRVLTLLIDEKDRDAIFVLLQRYILYEDIKKWDWIDKFSYGEYIPFDEV